MAVDTQTVSPAPERGDAVDGRPGGPPAGGLARLWAYLQDAPFVLWTLVCVALALLSAAVLPTVPSYDPWSWIVWGREVTDPHLSFFIGGGPSWKPLPFVFTAIYGAFGGAAPTLWVITERVGALLGLVGAYRLASLLVTRAGLGVVARVVAGLLAAFGVVVTTAWAYYFFRGASEPILIAMALWSIDRLIAGRHWQAYVLACAEGLMRPEAWPFLLVYGAWLWFRRPSLRWLVVAGLVAQPVGWFVPPWISTGQPFLAATHAHDYNGHLGLSWLSTVLKRGESLQSVPSLGFAVVAVGLALWRGRDRVVLGMAAGVVAWWIVVVGMTWDGYPGLQRFFLPAAAVTCVLGALGFVQLAALCGELARRVSPSVSAGLARGVAIGAGVVLLGLSWHYVSGRADTARAAEPTASQAVTRIDWLARAVAVAGGHPRVFPCGSSVATINHSLQTALAFKLHTTLERVHTVLHEPGLAFVGPHDGIDGGPPPIASSLSVHRLLFTVGPWRVYQVYAPGPVPHCVGS
jgi:hypothetical protein